MKEKIELYVKTKCIGDRGTYIHSWGFSPEELKLDKKTTFEEFIQKLKFKVAWKFSKIAERLERECEKKSGEFSIIGGKSGFYKFCWDPDAAEDVQFFDDTEKNGICILQTEEEIQSIPGLKNLFKAVKKKL